MQLSCNVSDVARALQGVKKGEPLKMGNASATQIGQNVTAQSMPPALPPRKSSDQSTLDVHKHIALQDSSNTVETVMKARAEGGALPRALSAERELHVPAKLPMAAPQGKALESGVLSGIIQQQPSTLAAAQVDFPFDVSRGFQSHRQAYILVWSPSLQCVALLHDSSSCHESFMRRTL